MEIPISIEDFLRFRIITENKYNLILFDIALNLLHIYHYYRIEKGKELNVDRFNSDMIHKSLGKD